MGSGSLRLKGGMLKSHFLQNSFYSLSTTYKLLKFRLPGLSQIKVSRNQSLLISTQDFKNPTATEITCIFVAIIVVSKVQSNHGKIFIYQELNSTV